MWGLALSACASPSPTLPREAPQPPTANATPNSTWLPLASGLDRREFAVPFPALGFEERVIAFRVDPGLYHFRVLYSPGVPGFVSAWDVSARLVFNASFFDEQDAALGLLVSDGRYFGTSYVGFGGMFSVAGGVPTIRSLITQPYQPGEALEQAVQGFPMLIYPDGSPYAKEDGVRARR
ncbi:MAG: hypothetical protein ACRDH2_04020, partial [Anaerolineales bacterium]